MKSCGIAMLLMLVYALAPAQYLGQTKKEVTEAKKNCLAIDKYATSIVFNCNGTKEYFYFQGRDTTCDLYARDLPAPRAKDTLNALTAAGFTQVGTRYVEPFLATKHGDHQKYPSKIYTDGKVEYCFMPVSINGKTADLNAVIVMYKKK